MTHILIIEDEQMLRSSMARGLSKLDDVTVTETGSVEDALLAIEAEPPDLIVSDIDLPGKSGLELLGELAQRSLRVPVVFASGYLKTYKSQIPRHVDVDVLEKPVSLEQLRSIVNRRIQTQRSAEEVAPFGVADYLQLACMGRHSVEVVIESEGQRLGKIVVWQGQVLTANDSSGDGEEAFSRLAFAPSSTVFCRAITSPPPEQTIQVGWEFLLMEAARQHDEGTRSASLPDPAPSLEPPPNPRAREDRMFERAWEAGIEALLAKRYPEALRAFREAADIRPLDPKVRANLMRLKQLGVTLESSSSRSQKSTETKEAG